MALAYYYLCYGDSSFVIYCRPIPILMQDNTDDKFGIVEQLAMRILLAEEDCWWCKGRS